MEVFIWIVLVFSGILVGWVLRGLHDRCNNPAAKLIIKEKK